jgi:hypothetical protein
LFGGAAFGAVFDEDPDAVECVEAFGLRWALGGSERGGEGAEEGEEGEEEGVEAHEGLRLGSRGVPARGGLVAGEEGGSVQRVEVGEGKWRSGRVAKCTVGRGGVGGAVWVGGEWCGAGK